MGTTSSVGRSQNWFIPMSVDNVDIFDEIQKLMKMWTKFLICKNHFINGADFLGTHTAKQEHKT